MKRKANSSKGYFGSFGGQYVPETLMPALLELEEAYQAFKKDPNSQKELRYYLRTYAGRPTPLFFAKRFSESLGNNRIYLKREDLLHTGAHKINNTLGQVLLAKKMGKRRVIAETGAGQHGVATATACALLGLECTIYMGSKDMKRQRVNLLKMKVLGAEVREVTTGSMTLKDAINEAIRDWVTNVKTTFYCMGSVVGPHPYPEMVRDFQSIIGKETRKQILESEGRLPDMLIACVGGGSNAIGFFYPFLKDKVKKIGVEAGGKGLETGQHAASLTAGRKGVLHGFKSFFLQDENGLILPAHSIAPGLDYPGVGPEHAYLKEKGLVEYTCTSDCEALEAFKALSRLEGIIPALESSHALAIVMKIAPSVENKVIVVNLSGRGDKDIEIAGGAQ